MNFRSLTRSLSVFGMLVGGIVASSEVAHAAPVARIALRSTAGADSGCALVIQSNSVTTVIETNPDGSRMAGPKWETRAVIRCATGRTLTATVRTFDYGRDAAGVVSQESSSQLGYGVADLADGVARADAGMAVLIAIPDVAGLGCSFIPSSVRSLIKVRLIDEKGVVYTARYMSPWLAGTCPLAPS